MTTQRYNVREMLDVAEMVRPEGEDLSTQDLELDQIESAMDAVKVWRAAHQQKLAAEAVLNVAGTRLAQLIGEEGAAAIGSNIVRYRVGQKESCINIAGFMAYVEQRIADGYDLADVFNANYAKKSWMPPGVRDTFFEKVADDEPSLSVTPRDKAPKFLQFLDDGEIFTKSKPEEHDVV